MSVIRFHATLELTLTSCDTMTKIVINFVYLMIVVQWKDNILSNILSIFIAITIIDDHDDVECRKEFMLND